jgi:carnitine-CoA ligase
MSLLERAVQLWPERVFIDFEDQPCTFRDFDREAARLANGLRAWGVKPADTVCVLLDTSLLGALFWFAINKVGAVYVPLNTALRGELLAHQLKDAAARVIIAELEYGRRAQELVTSSEGVSIFVRRPAKGVDTSSLHDIEELRRAPDAGVETDVRPTDLAMVIYTSGTTGLSKGCMVSHRYACSVSMTMIGALQMTAEDVHWSPLPLFHIYGTCGILLSALRVGARVALFARFSVSQFWPQVEMTHATVVHLVGSMIALIEGAAPSDAEKRCIGQVRVACGIPFAKASIDLWRNRFGAGWAGNAGYGLTEAGRVTQISILGSAGADTCGKPSNFEVRLFNDDDEECEPGKPGEIVVRPLHPGAMFDGYWRRPEETLQTLCGLWFHTGDIGRFDPDGNLIFVDRKKDYMRRGGENISSYEVEEVFRGHPAVLDVAAYGVPSALLEDDVKISVILKPDAAITELALCRWSIERLPYFCVPRYVEFLGEFPRSATGKVLKYVLKERGIDAAWDRSSSDLLVTR